jgi:hypothetical protein
MASGIERSMPSGIPEPIISEELLPLSETVYGQAVIGIDVAQPETGMFLHSGRGASMASSVLGVGALITSLMLVLVSIYYIFKWYKTRRSSTIRRQYKDIADVFEYEVDDDPEIIYL